MRRSRSRSEDLAIPACSRGLGPRSCATFIEDYHEKLGRGARCSRGSEQGRAAWPTWSSALRAQHQAGRRRHRQRFSQLAAPGSRKDGDDRRRLVTAMRSFIVMYRPHAAREDTDLFPRLRSLVSGNEYDAMAEDFENKEHQLFGDDGFEKMVDRVAQLERALGIHDLRQFTPRGT